MKWYWIVLIAFFASLLIASVGAVKRMFRAVFSGRYGDGAQEQAAKTDDSPVMRRRIETRAFMDAQKKEPWRMRSFDGRTMAADFYPNGESARVVILMHGWRSRNWWDYGAAFERLYRAGYAILSVSERASGQSEGEYVTFGVHEHRDLCGWIDLTAERLGKDVKIALFGVSMGAAAVLLATGNALPKTVRCAVSNCSYTTAEALFKSMTHGFLPLSRRLVDLELRRKANASFYDARPIDAVRRSTTPTLFVHGDADTLVPQAMCKELYDACTAEKAMWIAHGAGHGEAGHVDPDGYAAAVLPFLEKYMQ